MGEASQSPVSRTTLGAVHFHSGTGEYEEKTVVWKIDNVAEYLATSDGGFYQSGLTFEAGHCNLHDGTRIPAKWKYYFQYTKENGVDWVGGYLDFCPVNAEAKASHCVSFSSGGNSITSYAMEFKEFEPGTDCAERKLVTKSELLQKTMETNTLEVTLLVKVFYTHGLKPVLQGSPPTPIDVTEMRGEVILALVKMLESGAGANVEIKVPSEVGGEVDESSYTRKVHKGILMGRSVVFSAMFAENSEMVEAKTGKVVIPNLSPKGLDVFLRYLYTGEVLADWVQVLPELIDAAEMYDCGKLMQFLGHNFLAAVTTANAFKMWKLSKRHGLSFAAMGVKEFIQKNAKTLITEDVIDEIADTLE